MKIGYFGGSILLFFPFWLFAQTIARTGTLTIEDGLGFRNVTAAAQDSRGFLWLGTSQGLERYDGSAFLRFNRSKQADFFFPGGAVEDECLFTLNDTTLWLIADGKLYAFNPQTFAARDISASGGIPGVYCTLRRGPDGKIWAAVDDEVRQYLLCWDTGGRCRQVATSERLRRPFTAIAPDTDGNAWWSTITEGLRQFGPDGTLLHACKPDSFIWFGTKMYFTTLYADSRGRIFIFPKSVHQIWQYYPAERRHTVLADSLPTPTYYAREDSRGNIWFAQQAGLLCWNNGSGSAWTDHTPALKKALQFTKVHALFEDRAHLLWTATDNGLLKLPIGQHPFQTCFTVPGAQWGNALRGIFQDKTGNTWLYCETGNMGLHRLDARSGEIQPVAPFKNAAVPPDVFNGAQFFITDDRTNTAWALTDYLLKINLNDGTGAIVADVKNVADKNQRNPLIRLRDGPFLLGKTLGKLTLVDPFSGSQRSLSAALQPAERDIKTTCFWENDDGSIWVGAMNGLFRIGRNGAVMARYSTTSTPALGSDHLLALHADASGRLWIGTFGGGLNCLEPGGKTIRVFTRASGLCDDNVVSILEDGAGNIWAGTYYGLACYRRQTGTFQNFFEEDGLPNNEFNYASFLKDRSGYFWFGGMNGALRFDPKTILDAGQNPPLSLGWFARYNPEKGGLQKTHIPAGKLPLPVFDIAPGDVWFEFGYTLPNYFKPAKNRYYGRLEGLENNWTFLGNTPSVRYYRLPAGHYTLRIKAADSKGNPGIGELSIPIRVRPFFYQTWWFYLLVLCAVGAIVFFAARYRLLRRLEMEHLRTRIASDLHDEVGSMLAGLAMQAELLEISAPPKEAARLHHLGEISRSAVSKLRDLVWGLDSRRDLVRNLLERMQEQAAEILNPAGIACRFELGELPLEKKIPVDVRQHLFLIFKEAIANAARHSRATEVTVRFGYFDGQFELSVCDNGRVKESATPHTGLGMANMDLRARKLGAKLRVERGEMGFCVELRMRGI